MKACSKCKENKFINDFPKRFDNGKLRNECFVCISEYKKENKLKNKAKIALQAKKWYQKHKMHVILKSRKHYEINKISLIEKNRLRINQRYAVDPIFKLTSLLRGRLYKALRGNQKNGSAIKDLGCSIFKLKIHLQMKFYRNLRGKHEYMSWDNWSYNGWHIDHIKPLSLFDLTDFEQLKKACHYTNLQPLWAYENIRKSDK